MMRILSVSLAFALLASASHAQDAGLRELTDEEIAARITAIQPRPADFVFTAPTGWSPNLAATGTIASGIPAGAAASARATVDGDGYSTWVAPLGPHVPELTVDMGGSIVFDRFVVFARHTDARGTGGGNNALRKLAIAVSLDGLEPFRAVGEYAIQGPTPMCLKRVGGGQVCFFVDRTEPTTLELPETTARFVRVRLLDAHWGEYALAEWKTSVAVSEVMVFRSAAR